MTHDAADLRAMLKGYPGDWRQDTDMHQGKPEPEREKPVAADAMRIELPPPGRHDLSLTAALQHRRSRRDFAAKPLSLEALGFLLWSAQGVTASAEEATPALRTAPSAGGRFPLETYVLALRVNGIAPGVYRYLPDTRQLVVVHTDVELGDRVVEACYGQSFVGEAAAVIAWTAVPERTEWKYNYLAHRMIAMEAGHACQNLYLACEAIDVGACALLSYHQNRFDALLAVDGEDEFTLYLAAVGEIVD